jgi:TPR repeat protein
VRHATRALMAFTILALANQSSASATGLSYRADNYRRGLPVANHRLQVLAERGDARAQTLLGLAYATGRGVPQYFSAAVYWYQRAAEQGNPNAQYLLGLAYDKGQGVAQDKIIAEKWLNLAAAKARGRDRDYYARIRDAVASTMDPYELAQAQYLAQIWTVERQRWILENKR